MTDANGIHREWAEEHRRAQRWPEDLPDYDPAYDREEQKCRRCRGRGYVVDTTPEGDAEECPRCDGEGAVEVRL